MAGVRVGQPGTVICTWLCFVFVGISVHRKVKRLNSPIIRTVTVKTGENLTCLSRSDGPHLPAVTRHPWACCGVCPRPYSPSWPPLCALSAVCPSSLPCLCTEEPGLASFHLQNLRAQRDTRQGGQVRGIIRELTTGVRMEQKLGVVRLWEAGTGSWWVQG